jgi:hypothetical protein
MTHTTEMGTWESSRTPENSKLDWRGQNTSPWGVLYTVGKVLKCRCRNWPCMSHSNICSTSYGRKKGWESNWQFDSWPLKVGNQPDPGVWRWSATHRWKALKESYKFASDLITKSWESTQPRCVKVECDTPLESSQGELQVCFKPHPNRRSKQGVMSYQSPGNPNRDSFGSPGKKCHSDVGATE